MQLKRFIFKCLIKLKHNWPYLAAKIEQEKLSKSASDSVLLFKFNAIKNQLMNTDKTFLVGLILSEKITDDSDIHYYYERLEDYRKELSGSKNI